MTHRTPQSAVKYAQRLADRFTMPYHVTLAGTLYRVRLGCAPAGLPFAITLNPRSNHATV